MNKFISLTDDQRDLLAESINIGFGRAAASLSVLVGQKVLLEVPIIQVISIPELSAEMAKIYKQPLSVLQHFNGAIQGDVFLFMDMDIAAVFIDLLSGGDGSPRRLTASDREALTEVGNILLNAYIGSFGNLMRAQISISVPELHMEGIKGILPNTGPEGHHVLLVWTKFVLKNGSVAGHVALILDAASLETLVATIEFDEFGQL